MWRVLGRGKIMRGFGAKDWVGKVSWKTQD